jgi:hypothetical protein
MEDACPIFRVKRFRQTPHLLRRCWQDIALFNTGRLMSPAERNERCLDPS